MKSFTSTQTVFKKAIERDVQECELQQSTLITLLLTNRQIEKILRLPWQDRCILQEEGIIPINWGRRVFYYSPLDIHDLFTSNTEHY